MKITKFEAKSFRNLKDVEFVPDEGINIIFGENGQGKTNIIEAIWLFTGFKSFRTRKNSEMIPYDEEKYEIVPIYITKDREWYTGDMLKDIEEYTKDNDLEL